MTQVLSGGLPPGVRNAATWRLAAALVGGLPGGRVESDRDRRDALVVTNRSGSVRLSLDKQGDLHVLAAPRLPGAFSLWPESALPDASSALAERVLVAAGVATSVRNRSPERLGYQVIAHVLSARSLEAPRWDAVSLRDDDHAQDVRRPTAMELTARPEDVWAIVCGSTTVAWIFGGWLIRPGGERIDLTRERRAGAGLADLAAVATRRRPTSTARTLKDRLPRSTPEQDAVPWLEFAGRYNAYERLAGDPEHLTELIAPARREFEATGRVPDWCGQDLLRAWLFLIFREDHFAGGYLFSSDRNQDTVQFKAVAEAWRVRGQ